LAQPTEPKKAHIEKNLPSKKFTGPKTLQKPYGSRPIHGFSSST